VVIPVSSALLMVVTQPKPPEYADAMLQEEGTKKALIC